jgi:surface polysaccharide O-acyltransferase-like enzyme
MKNRPFFDYVHSFRGFAILNIVAIHAFAFSLVIPRDWEPDMTAPLYVLNETIFHDSTIYFALISGLLFSAVLSKKGLGHFFRNKTLYVLSPYIVCTMVFSAMRWDESGTGVFVGPESFVDYASSILPNLIRGEAQFTYWYIPVLLILFALTPLLSRLTLSTAYAAAPMWLIMMMPLVFSRPEFEPGVIQVNLGTVIYFTGAYTVGLYLGNNLEPRLEFLSRHRKWFAIAALLSSLALVALQFRGLNRFGFFSLQESLYYVQKLCLAAVVLTWLRQRREGQPRWLTGFANEAFSIYFLHVFFIIFLADLFWAFLHDESFQPLTIYLSGWVYLGFALGASLTVVSLMRAVFGKYSRQLIGS